MKNVELGRHSYAVGINNHFNIPVKVGNFTSIAHDVTIVGNEHPNCASTYPFRERWGASSNYYNEDAKIIYEAGIDYPFCTKAKSVVIGNDVWIGQGAVIFQGSRIADGCIIGAYCVVKGNTDPYNVYIGNPKRVLKCRLQRYSILGAMLKMKWWNWPDETIAKALPYFNNAEKLIDFAIKEGLYNG